MIDDFACPACGHDQWEPLGVHHYDEARIGEQTAKRQLRWRVLFEVWRPGQHQVELRSVLCANCGFAAYTPRPTAADVEAKYRFLNAARPPKVESQPTRGKYEVRRARATSRALLRHLPRREGFEVLDVGGGDGRLMVPLMQRARRCALVDYDPNPLPGIDRIGETLAHVPTDQRFDALILSHVLEHVADPGAMLDELPRLMRADGLVYAEVPLELWHDVPIDDDPVTHINFFTEHSLSELFERHGFHPLEVRTRGSVYEGTHKEVVVLVAERGPARARAPHADDHRRVTPSKTDSMRRALRRRSFPGGRYLRRVERLATEPLVRSTGRRLASKAAELTAATAAAAPEQELAPTAPEAGPR